MYTNIYIYIYYCDDDGDDFDHDDNHGGNRNHFPVSQVAVDLFAIGAASWRGGTKHKHLIFPGAMLHGKCSMSPMPPMKTFPSLDWPPFMTFSWDRPPRRSKCLGAGSWWKVHPKPFPQYWLFLKLGIPPDHWFPEKQMVDFGVPHFRKQHETTWNHHSVRLYMVFR